MMWEGPSVLAAYERFCLSTLFTWCGKPLMLVHRLSWSLKSVMSRSIQAHHFLFGWNGDIQWQYWETWTACLEWKHFGNHPLLKRGVSTVLRLHRNWRQSLFLAVQNIKKEPRIAISTAVFDWVIWLFPLSIKQPILFAVQICIYSIFLMQLESIWNKIKYKTDSIHPYVLNSV